MVIDAHFMLYDVTMLQGVYNVSEYKKCNNERDT